MCILHFLLPSSMYKNIGVACLARACSTKFVVALCFWNCINTSVQNEFGLIVKEETGMMLITCWGFDDIILTF